MILERNEKLGLYYAIFLIALLFPQIFNINSSFIDLIWKSTVLIVFLCLTYQRNSLNKLDLFSLIYILILIFGTIFSSFFNNIILNISTYYSFAISILLFNIFYIVPSKSKIVNINSIFLFYKIYTVFIIVACLYNMLIHANVLFHLASTTVYNSTEVCAFFDNKNSFGIYLLFGCLSASILHIETRKKRWILSSLIFIVNELMAMCRTAVILSFFLLVFTYFFAGNGKMVFRILIIATMIGVLIIIIKKNNVINDYVFDNLFGSTSSLDTRNNYVQEMKQLIKGDAVLWGYGNQEARLLAVEFTGNQYFHNTYLKVLMQGGIFAVYLLISSITISILNAIKIIKFNKQLGLFCLITIIIYCVYSWIEAIILFDTPVISMVATLFTVTMPLLFKRVLERRIMRRNL